jgi:Domain of Unknown Function (DUF1521)
MTAITNNSVCGCPANDVSKPNTSYDAQGNVQFENKNYRISANEGGTVNIFNKNTGETYQAWGDPHMKIDGQQAFDFWGTTTLSLDDGTKVTIDTTPWKGGNNGATITSKVTITDGNYGVQISGIDDNKSGDMKFNETTSNGWLMDAMVEDGNTMYENPIGKGFVAMDDYGNVHKVDQKWVDGTDMVKNGGKEKVDEMSKKLGALVTLFTGIMTIAFAGVFLSSLAHAASNDNSTGNATPTPKGGRDHCHPKLDNQRPTDFDFFMIVMSRSAGYHHAIAA